MKNVTILAMFNTMASSVIAPMDIFYQAGMLWNYFNRQKLTPQFRKDHRDDRILAVQEWIEHNFQQNFNYDHLSRDHGMSRRTFERRFKSATGDTPLIYQQRIRVEAAKRLLEGSNRSFDEITAQVGYEDGSSFRRVFIKQTGLRPNEYRRKFQRGPEL